MKTLSKMRSGLQFLAATLFVLLGCLTISGDAQVIELTQSNFFPTVQTSSKKQWLVKFHAVWCGHCKRLAPIWEQLSQSKEAESVGIAKVDATKNRDLADKFLVKGYPTLIFLDLDDDTYIKYTGQRALEDLQTFIGGGYKTFDKSPMPAPPGLKDALESAKKRFRKEYGMLEEDFIHIWSVRKNAMTAFVLIGGVIGALLGLLVGCTCRGGTKKTIKSKTE
jgi:protein disulfide-isomerase-like protein